MFTGLISDVAIVTAVEDIALGKRFVIACNYEASSIPLGASIACDGACMTVTSVAPQGQGAAFSIDVSPESLKLTTLKDWKTGARINLERSLKLGDELGGHMVTGHVDGLARIEEIAKEGDFLKFTFSAPYDLAKFIARKGSVALNGTSLTVNSVVENTFTVQMIPHTINVTNWNGAHIGQFINLEVDLMARYAARLLEASNKGEQK